MAGSASYSVTCPTAGHGTQQVISNRTELGWGDFLELGCGCRVTGNGVATKSTTGLQTGIPKRNWTQGASGQFRKYGVPE